MEVFIELLRSTKWPANQIVEIFATPDGLTRMEVRVGPRLISAYEVLPNTSDGDSGGSGGGSDSAPRTRRVRTAVTPASAVSTPVANPEQVPDGQLVGRGMRQDKPVEAAAPIASIGTPPPVNTPAHTTMAAAPVDFLRVAAEIPAPTLRELPAVIEVSPDAFKGRLYEDPIRAKAALDYLRRAIGTAPGVTWESVPQPSATSVDFRLVFNTTLADVARVQAAILETCTAFMFKAEFVKPAMTQPTPESVAIAAIETIVNAMPAVVAATAPIPAPTAPLQPELPKTNGNGASYTLQVPTPDWKRLDPNQRARLKRTMRRAGMDLIEGDSIATQPFPKSQPGLMEVMSVLREFGIKIEAKAA